jgi:ATP-dependent RNA helicase DOB1
VIYTDYRPTPLQHYVFPAGGDGLHLVIDEKGTFHDDSFHKALAQMVMAPESGGRSGNRPMGKPKRGEQSDIFKLIQMIVARNYDPVSRWRQCSFFGTSRTALTLLRLPVPPQRLG